MIERLTTEVKRSAEQANCCDAEQLRLSMVWYLNPMTGRLAARWVFAVTEATVVKQLSAAA
jgi:hypothetical protein